MNAGEAGCNSPIGNGIVSTPCAVADVRPFSCVIVSFVGPSNASTPVLLVGNGIFASNIRPSYCEGQRVRFTSGSYRVGAIDYYLSATARYFVLVLWQIAHSPILADS